MQSPRPERVGNTSRIITRVMDDGTVAYKGRDGSGWWSLRVLPHAGNTELVSQIQLAWADSGDWSEAVREQLPVLAAFLDLLSPSQQFSIPQMEVRHELNLPRPKETP